MDLNIKIAEFVAFCMENYKIKLKNVKGTQVAEYFSNYKIDTFLIKNYDILHTLGKNQILSEIDHFLQKRGF